MVCFIIILLFCVWGKSGKKEGGCKKELEKKEKAAERRNKLLPIFTSGLLARKLPALAFFQIQQAGNNLLYCFIELFSLAFFFFSFNSKDSKQ